MDPRLLEILVCPLCKGPLTLVKVNQLSDQPSNNQDQCLVCEHDQLAYHIRDGIPVLLVDQAQQLNAVTKMSTTSE